MTDMLTDIINIIFIDIVYYTSIFCITDYVIKHTGARNPYYLIHSFHNALIVLYTYTDIINTFTDFQSLPHYYPNYNASALCFALHIYHIIMYYTTFRFDDWLHHIIMIAIALPIGIILPSSTLLGFSLFFTTGLPGCIDYMLLYLVRNGEVLRTTEKRINTWLNVWIRAPGCVAHATVTFIYLLTFGTHLSPFVFWLACIPPLTNYWNGMYFMQQVVIDYARQN